MKAAAGGAAAVDDGDAGLGHVVAVGGAAGVDPPGVKARFGGGVGDLLDECPGVFGKRHGGRVAQLLDGLRDALDPSLFGERADLRDEFAAVLVVPEAQVERHFGVVGDDVGARAAVDEAGIDRRAAGLVVELVGGERKAHGGDVGVAAVLRIVACVRREALEGEADVGGALAGAHEFAAGTRGFKDERGLRVRGELAEPFLGGAGAELLVGIEDAPDAQTLEVFGTGVAAGVEDGEHAALAVGAARTVSRRALDREGARGGRAVGEDRVEMGVEDDVAFGRARLVAADEAAARRRAQVDELGLPADRFEVTLHHLGCGRDARTVGRAAVAVDEFGEVAHVFFKHAHG